MFEKYRYSKLFAKYIAERSIIGRLVYASNRHVIPYEEFAKSPDAVLCYIPDNEKTNDLYETINYIASHSDKVAYQMAVLDRVSLQKLLGNKVSFRDSKSRIELARKAEEHFRNLGVQNFTLGFTKSYSFLPWFDSVLLLTGSHIPSTDRVRPLRRVLAFIQVYNEIDILPHIIDYYLRNGIELLILDNWSDDGSYDYVKELSKREQMINVERYPSSGRSEVYDAHKYLTFISKRMKEMDFDWYIHLDADEIRLSPIGGLTYQQFISAVDDLGYNAIDQTVMDFRPVDERFTGKENPERHFSFFQFGKRIGHFTQIKTFRIPSDMRFNLADSAGHQVQFDGIKVYPLKLLLKHYPIRSSEHGNRKIFKERLPRYAQAGKKRGWHTQYLKYAPGHRFIWSRWRLNFYDPRLFKYDYFIERMSGIGIL